MKIFNINSRINLVIITSNKLPKQHEWNRAVASAEKMVGFPTSLLNLQSLMNDDVTGKKFFITNHFFMIILLFMPFTSYYTVHWLRWYGFLGFLGTKKFLAVGSRTHKI